MTDEYAHTTTTGGEPHVADELSHDEHGHDDAGHDEHGDGGEALGPIDWAKWGYAIVGAIAAMIVIAMFFFALGGLPA